MIKKLCVVSSGRSDYSLLYFLLNKINNYKRFKLQLVVTGSHLSKYYGNTYFDIESDGFTIDKKIYLNDKIVKNKDINTSISNGINKFNNYFSINKPDLLILLGDRYELLAPAVVSNFLNIPIAHIHGGEKTEGSYDDLTRHIITKYSYYHFVSHINYKKRVVQLGEDPKRVFVTGSLGTEIMSKTKLLKLKILEKKLKIKINNNYLLITFHPETNDISNKLMDIKELLSALKKFENYTLIFTMPGNDSKSIDIINEKKKFVNQNVNAFYFKSLGRVNYYSLLKNAKLIIGNSSSGILEAPYFKTSTINIGSRQNGRLQSKSIFNCKAKKIEIIKTIEKVLNNTNKRKIDNPYKKLNASLNIFNEITKLSLKVKKYKKFYDI